MKKKKIGILTGGGDCPGLNAVIRAITRIAIRVHDWEVVGILDGFDGAVTGRAMDLKFDDVSNILPQGGTILGTSNKANPFDFNLYGCKNEDKTKVLLKNFKKWGIEILFCVGGDGTLSIADKLTEIFPRIIGIPKTIDNDLKCTDQTFGFDTACNFVTESIDRIHTTAQSHHRVMVIEVMGRYAGWIALNGGLAGGGDIILIPEMPFRYDKIIDAIQARSDRGKKFSIIVAAEGAFPEGGSYSIGKMVEDSPDKIRLGGIGNQIAEYVEKETGHESRVTVLGHLQRGGTPSYFDRILATSYGTRAAELAEQGDFGKMVALQGNKIVGVNIKEAVAEIKRVTPDHPMVCVAKSLGTSFGV